MGSMGSAPGEGEKERGAARLYSALKASRHLAHGEVEIEGADGDCQHAEGHPPPAGATKLLRFHLLDDLRGGKKGVE